MFILTIYHLHTSSTEETFATRADAQLRVDLGISNIIGVSIRKAVQ